MRTVVYAVLIAALPTLLAAWDSFLDTSCNTRVHECMAKWLPTAVVGDSEDDSSVSDKSGDYQTGFCDCWLGLRAGDCKDTAMSNDEGVVRYGTCGSGTLSRPISIIIFSSILAIFLGHRQGNT